MRNSILFLFSISLLLNSCGPKINSEQQNNLELLTAKVDSIVNEVNTLDSVALMDLTNDFFDRKNYLQRQVSDTIAPELIFKIDSFIQLRKGMGFIRGEFSPIKTEANILKQQLEDLSHDVDNRLVEEKQFDRYFELEKNNFDELSIAYQQLSVSIELVTKKYNLLAPGIDSFIEDYKARIND